MTVMQETIIRKAIKMYEDYLKEYERFGHSSSLYIDYIHQLDLLDFDCYLIDLIRTLIDRQIERHEDPEKLLIRIDHFLNVIRTEDILLSRYISEDNQSLQCYLKNRSEDL